MSERNLKCRVKRVRYSSLGSLQQLQAVAGPPSREERAKLREQKILKVHSQNTKHLQMCKEETHTRA